MKLHNFLARSSSSSSLSPAVARGNSAGTYIRTSLAPHEDGIYFFQSLALQFTDICSLTVPIYDARNVDFNLKKDVASVKGLPLFEGGRQEIPDGSCVSVGHTVGIFKNKTGDESLTLNVHWVIIWGVPNKRY
ncbi:hypothetical protein GALMADRAFT_75666 [Galerina marginata CBS 339.88]|uniref:Uncharacterized protein n=1 Tax=Galerina marginata (strain CBS 339.88) TaxID=685588 RepID=A0A067SLA4_GALM3|nr:hypothetical protein GALMADRAFT_75666 [Galerina marginata CBS 339.88]